ncbi:MAG: aldose epimerase family protein [Gudongella sp.]|nr:aldose epimerase family protein [Gudongella sp.]
MNIEEVSFGIYNNQEIKEYTLDNGNYLSLKILTLGAIIKEVKFKGKNRVLGFNNVEDYINSRFYFGALVGRVAGRISNGEFHIGEKSFKLDQNEGKTCLHGGKEGFTFKVWELEDSVVSEEFASVTLKYISQDLDSGFPGVFTVYVKYTISKDNSFKIEYSGFSSKDTPVTLTNHSYFNLNNDLSNDILDHYLKIDADEYIRLDKNNIPIEISRVEESPFDFRKSKIIKRDMDLNHEELKVTKGYDHPFVLNDGSANQVELFCKESGIKLNLFTTEPVVVVYCSNNLGGGYTLIEGEETFKYQGVCLETQWYPDALNQEFLPNNVLDQGKEYYSKTKFKFS